MTDKFADRHFGKPYYKSICDFQEYLLYVRRLAHTTTWGYVSFMADFCAFLSVVPEQATRQDIIDFIKYKKSKNVMDSSISSYIGAMRSFYNWVADRNDDENLRKMAFFLTKIVRMTREHTIKEVPTPQEVDRLRKTIHAYRNALSFNKSSKKYGIVLRDAALIELMIAIGPRSTEIRNVSPRDIDVKERTVLVRKGKGSRQRHSIFSDLTKDTLVEYIRYKKFSPDDLIFKMTGSMLNILVNKWSRHASINDRITSHSFRHYHVTESQRNGVPVQAVADQVGHVNLNTTRRYTHLDVGFRREHYEKIIL